MYNLKLSEINNLYTYYTIIWKINVEKLKSVDCFVKFIIKGETQVSFNSIEHYIFDIKAINIYFNY